MQKDSLTQYLHFYLNGKKALYAMLPNDERVAVTGIFKHDSNWYVNYVVQDKFSSRCGESDTIMLDVVKPILRPMSERNEEEATRWNMGANSYQSYALRIKFYTDRYLDVFGLIKKGIAIDAATVDVARQHFGQLWALAVGLEIENPQPNNLQNLN